MILPPVVCAFVAVLLLASPVLSQDEVPVPLPDDPSAALQGPLSRSTSAATPGWLVCSRRCKTNCLSNPKVDKCAKNFISHNCRKFDKTTAATVKSLCLGAITCLKNGNGVCDNNMECILPGQCCLDRGCSSNSRCLNHWCAPKGSLSFTLMWSGLDDLDLYVSPPAWYTLGPDYTYEPETGFRYQHNAIPGTRNSTWQETVYFPSDRTPLDGTYTYWVYNNHAGLYPPTPYVINIYEGDSLVISESDTVDTQQESYYRDYFFNPWD